MIVLSCLFLVLLIVLMIYIAASFSAGHFKGDSSEFLVHRLTGEEAEHAYQHGRFKDGEDCQSFVPEGFYAKKLTFEEWLNRYQVVIVD